MCVFCDAEFDSPEHTLSECPQWTADRDLLMNAVGNDVSLAGIMRAVVASREAWGALSLFAVKVMSVKEMAERVRQTRQVEEDRFLSPPSSRSVDSYNEYSDGPGQT